MGLEVVDSLMTPLSTHSNRGRQSLRFWVLIVAFADFVLGALVILPFTLSNPNILPKIIIPFSVGLAAGISGGLFWWIIVERPSKPTLARGLVFGFLSVLIAFPLWFFLTLPLIAIPVLEPVNVGDLMEVVRSVTNPDSFTWFLFFGAIAVGGIIAFPPGIVVGLLLVMIRRRFPVESES